jgi:hypothetical protein
MSQFSPRLGLAASTQIVLTVGQFRPPGATEHAAVRATKLMPPVTMSGEHATPMVVASTLLSAILALAPVRAEAAAVEEVAVMSAD